MLYDLIEQINENNDNINKNFEYIKARLIWHEIIIVSLVIAILIIVLKTK